MTRKTEASNLEEKISKKLIYDGLEKGKVENVLYHKPQVPELQWQFISIFLKITKHWVEN